MRTKMLIHPSVAERMENGMAMCSKIEWDYSDIQTFLEAYLNGISGTAELRGRELQEQITDLVLEGKRGVYVWDEMNKMSEMMYIRSRAPFDRPVVDLCCGYGYWISKVLCGIDLGIDMFPDSGRYQRSIEGIRERSFIDDTYRVVLQCDVTTPMPLPAQSVGTVFAICSLEHIRNYENAVEEVKRILKPGGRFILTVDGPVIVDVLKEVFNERYAEKFLKEHQIETLLSLDEWKDVLMRIGFEIEDVTGYIDRLRTFLYLTTFYPSDFNSYWTKLGFTDLFRENAALRETWNRAILPCLTKTADPRESMLICMTAKRNP